MKINKIANEIHQDAKDKGWWDKEINIPEQLSLIHLEISEALEDYRTGDMDVVLKVPGLDLCGFPTELADIIIRVLDLSEYLMIDITKVIRQKINYNKTRSYRHGGKKC